MTHAHIARAARRTTAALLIAAAACTMKKQEEPPLSGPSEYATSVSISVSPDVLTQDGASQSLITVTARDASGQPLRSLSLRAEIQVGGVRADFGSLSARNLVTGADGRATLVYTAPAAPSVAVDEGTVVDIAITPVGSDFNNSSSRTASIRLVPPGIVIPPDGLKPAFTMTPSAAVENQNVVFDASASAPANGITEYRWNFGDGETKTGRSVVHDFALAGTYGVTLTISDAYGRSASVTQPITIGAGAEPTAAFVSSPSAPLPGQPVNFNASASRPSPGRSLVSYQWDFGDGTTGTGVTVSHVYAVAGSYTVTLVVTDDVGHVGSVSQGVTLTTGAPTADFTYVPPAPAAGVSVAFNGSASAATSGRTITSYSWSFGDGTAASGVAPTHVFGLPGAYNVTLTVTDSAGQTGTVTKTVIVS